MTGKVKRIDERGDGYCNVEIRAGKTNYTSVVRDDFKVEVGATVEFEQDEDGDVHVTDVMESGK